MENAFGQPQTVVVIGGSSDIARAITRQLCAQRARQFVLAGRNERLLGEARTEALAAGARQVDVVLFDARDVSSAEGTVNECFEHVAGAVDLVVIAVGQLGDQLSFEEDAALVGEMMNVNFTWPVAALAQLRKRLVLQGSGRLVVITSVAAVRVRRAKYLYGGAKAGLDRLCIGLAESLNGTGVSLQLVRPGHVRSKMTSGLKEPPFATDVNEVADDVIKGLADRSPVIWSPPTLRYLYFVLRHLPAPLWRQVTDAVDR